MNDNKVIINNMPTSKLLTKQETYQLINNYQKHQDINSKDKLVLGNLKLVLSLTKRFYGRTSNTDDLFQVGVIGLLKAIENFDVSYNLSFSTYAVPLIIGEMKRYLRDNNGIKVSRTLKDIAYQIMKLKEEYTNKDHTNVSPSMIMERLDISRELYNEALLSTNPLISLQETINSDNDVCLEEQISKEYGVQDSLNQHSDLIDALHLLNKREKTIIRGRYYYGLSQCELAKKLSISQAQVSRSEKKALHKMYKYLKGTI